MKITKKKPLRPRGRTDEKRQSAKDAIRDAYANGPQREVQIIPAKRDLETGQPQKKLRVCAYCRVSTDEDTQASSYELQVQNYTKMIQEKGSKFCRCSQIPEPLLYSITTEVLGLEEFDPDIFESKITVIEAHDDNTLVFCFTDGTQTVKRWQHRSRAESWTPEMRENARQRTAQQKTPNRGWHGYFQSTET